MLWRQRTVLQLVFGKGLDFASAIKSIILWVELQSSVLLVSNKLSMSLCKGRILLYWVIPSEWFLLDPWDILPKKYLDNSLQFFYFE